MLRARCFAVVFFAAAALAVPDRASAQDATADAAAEARSQYQQGTQAFQAKRYVEAALHFESAASSRPHAVALYTAGLAWDLASKPERAADAYARSLEVAGLDAKQAAQAKERLAQIEKTVGTILVTGPDGWKVQLDSSAEVATPARLHAAPGAHVVLVHASGKPTDKRDVALEAGKLATIELKDEPKPAAKVEPEPAASPPTPPPSTAPTRDGSYWSARRVIGVGVAGLGVAALAGSAVLGINANGAKDAYDAAPTRAAFDHASSLQAATNVSLIAGAALLAGGIVLVVLPDGDGARVDVAVGPAGAALGGRF